MEWSDGKQRCSWANPHNPDYVIYHDTVWGRPVHDDHELFRMLILETFQSGLSWECILNKMDAFDAAFDHFNLDAIKNYDASKIEDLMTNPGIVRNRKKIEAAIHNAEVFESIQKECGSFDAYLWHWTQGKTICEEDRPSSPLSDALSSDLKRRGMKFVGSVTLYSYMQAVGVLSGHEKSCFLMKEAAFQ